MKSCSMMVTLERINNQLPNLSVSFHETKVKNGQDIKYLGKIKYNEPHIYTFKERKQTFSENRVLVAIHGKRTGYINQDCSLPEAAVLIKSCLFLVVEKRNSTG